MAEGISYSEQERLSDFPDLENIVRPSSRDSQKKTASLEVKKISSKSSRILGCSPSVLRDGVDLRTVAFSDLSLPGSHVDSIRSKFFEPKMRSLVATFSASGSDRLHVGEDSFSGLSTSLGSTCAPLFSRQISESEDEKMFVLSDLEYGLGEELGVSLPSAENISVEMCSFLLFPASGTLLLESSRAKISVLPKSAGVQRVMASEFSLSERFAKGRKKQGFPAGLGFSVRESKAEELLSMRGVLLQRRPHFLPGFSFRQTL
ncbi:hypothetical protein [Leptospira fletcheri]|uniref:hypothetical protein n=1 Tax=Leptospira fletcheri TaxID=2484981 RepID=UPI0014384B5C|nr:hypothetical protein [Leptospira fletcheri]